MRQLLSDGSVISAKNSDREPNEAHEIVLVPHTTHIEGNEGLLTVRDWWYFPLAPGQESRGRLQPDMIRRGLGGRDFSSWLMGLPGSETRNRTAPRRTGRGYYSVP